MPFFYYYLNAPEVTPPPENPPFFVFPEVKLSDFDELGVVTVSVFLASVYPFFTPSL